MDDRGTTKLQVSYTAIMFDSTAVRRLPIAAVANSILAQVVHPMLKIFPESLDPSATPPSWLSLAGKVDHKFSLGMAPIT